MHELTHLQTNFGISAPALIACILGCCILCLWKAENISHSQALHRSTVRQEEGEGFLKLLLRQGGAVGSGLGRERRQSLCLLMFQGPSLLFICIDLQEMEPPEEPWPCCSSANPLTAFTILRAREEFSLPPSHEAFLLHWGISPERRNFQLHGSDDEFNLWIVSYCTHLTFQGKIKPDTPGNKSNTLLWGNAQLETLLWSPVKSEPGGSPRGVLLSHLEKDRGWITMRHSLLWHKLQLYQEQW